MSLIQNNERELSMDELEFVSGGNNVSNEELFKSLEEFSKILESNQEEINSFSLKEEIVKKRLAQN